MWLNWKNTSNKTNLHQEACFPKVEAAIAFVNGRPEGKAVITSLENLGALIESESGTIIQKD